MSFQYRSDRELRKFCARNSKNVATKKIAFDSFTDIKSEIAPLAIKDEPKWEMEIDTSRINMPPANVDVVDLKDIVIADTVIRKVGSADSKSNISIDVDVSKSILWLFLKLNFELAQLKWQWTWYIVRKTDSSLGPKVTYGDFPPESAALPETLARGSPYSSVQQWPSIGD